MCNLTSTVIEMVFMNSLYSFMVINCKYTYLSAIFIHFVFKLMATHHKSLSNQTITPKIFVNINMCSKKCQRPQA